MVQLPLMREVDAAIGQCDDATPINGGR
jgi:hypothetical protein